MTCLLLKKRLENEDVTRLARLHEALMCRVVRRKAHNWFYYFISKKETVGIKTKSSVFDDFLQL